MDEIALRRAQRGDEDAFEALVTPYEALLWRICWRYTRSTPDAQDCLQETMVKAWRALPGFRGECSLQSWLYRICVSCCMDHVRTASRRREESVEAVEGFDPADPAPQPEEAVLRREKQRQVHEAIRALPEPMRDTLILTVLEGRSYEEAAALTGASVGTVKSRVNRARQKLLTLLNMERRDA